MKRLVALISTKGKSPQEVAEQAVTSLARYKDAATAARGDLDQAADIRSPGERGTASPSDRPADRD